MKCDKKDLLLYAVTDRHWLNGRSLNEVVKESLDGGVTFVQLREKELDDETLRRRKNCSPFAVSTMYPL